MKVLYIGGTGEISLSCVAESVRAGHETAVFNRGGSNDLLDPSVRQIVGDMTDATTYAKLGDEHWDAVCQFLAFKPEQVMRDVEVFSGSCGQYVFISSASAYQKPPRDYVVTEATPLDNPYWAYSRAKIEAETALMTAHRQDRLPVTIVRPSHTIRTRFPGGIAGGDDWAWRMLNGRPIVVHGDGTSLWTLTASDDFARPFVRLLGNSRTLGEAYHITRHMKAYAWREIYHAMADALGVQADLVFVPTETLIRCNDQWTGPMMGDKTWSVMFDNSKIAAAVGDFSCEVDLAEMMTRSAEHYATFRKDCYQPKQEKHDLLDRIARRQRDLAPGD